MARAGRIVVRVLLITLVFTALASASDASPRRHRKRPPRQHQPPHTAPRSSPPTPAPPRFTYVRKPPSSTPLDKRGVAGMAGDIEWMGFYGSLLAVPTMLSVLGIITNYNLEKSYFNSQLNAQYYKQSREMLRAHSAKLIREQEMRFAQAGVQWKGMIYDKDGNVRPGAQVPTWHGKEIGAPVQQSAAQPGAQPAAQPATPPAANTGGGGGATTPGADTSAAAPGTGSAVAPGGSGTTSTSDTTSGGGGGGTAATGGSDAINAGDGSTKAAGGQKADDGGLLGS